MAEMLENEVGEIDAVEQQNQQAEVVKDEDADLPEKFKGKSKADIAKAYLEAEKTIGKQAQEVGEVRRLADELLKQQISKKAEIEKPVEVDFFENPQEAMRQAIGSNPDVKQAREYATYARNEQARLALVHKHPDMQQIVSDGEFLDFVKASPVRMKLYQQADNFDTEAADELLSTFKQIRTVKAAQTTELNTQAAATEAAARKKSVTAASVDIGGSSESSKPIFRRAKLLEMQLRRPDEYRQLADSGELALAYQEGRVK